MDGLGQELLGLGDEAGQGVQPDGGVAEPVGGAQPGELVDRLGEDLQAVVAGGGGGQLAGAGQAQWRAVHEASWSMRASSEANSCPRWSWCLVDGVVVLGLQGGAELDAGLEERAGLADRLERAVQLGGPGALAVAEHPVVLAAQPGHLRADRVGGQHGGLAVEGVDLAR